MIWIIISFISNYWSDIISNNIGGFIINFLFFVVQILIGSYNEKKLSYYIGNNISTTDIIVWNNGRQTLYYDSTYSGRHTPKIKGNNISETHTIRVNSSVEDMNIIHNGNNLVLDFNKMEPRDCFIVSIPHAEHDGNNDIHIDFELNNFKITKYNSLKKVQNCYNTVHHINSIGFSILFLIFHISALISNMHKITTIDTMIGPIIFTCLLLYIIYNSIKQLINSHRTPIPDILKQYLSDKLK